MSSITFKIYVSKQKSDGTYPVRIRVTYQRKQRWMTTNLSLSQHQLTKGLRIKDPAVQRTLDVLLMELREKSNGMDMMSLANMGVDDILEYLKDGSSEFRLDFPEYARGQITRMGAGAKNYRSALVSLTAFLGKDRYDISEITSSVLRRWQECIEDKYGKGARAVSLYTQSISHIHGLARQAYNDEEQGSILIKNPFSKYKCPKQSPGKHRNVSPALVQLMLLWRDKLSGRERLGVDVFLLSFAFMGANAPDLYECGVSGGMVTYNRRKTRDRRADGAEMRVRIEPQVRWLVNEYLAPDGKSFIFSKRYSSYLDFGRAVNIGLHEFEKRVQLSAPLTLYVCRHTFATIASSRVCNIDKSVVNDCICHVDASMRVTNIYVEKDWSVIWDANAKVQSIFSWNLRNESNRDYLKQFETI